MTAATSEQVRLYCDGCLVGATTNVRWDDFPWLTGTFVPAAIDDDVREVIDWFAAIGDGDELVDPPFPARLVENWWLERPGGERSCPTDTLHFPARVVVTPMDAPRPP